MLFRALATALIWALLLPIGAAAQGSSVDAGAARLSSPRTAHAAVLLQSGDVLVLGGSSGEGSLASVELIDPRAGSVTRLGDLSSPRAGHTATPLSDGRILIAGGAAAGKALASAELYDPATGRSMPAGSMWRARVSHQAVPLEDGRVLLVGGVNDDGPVLRAELYDPTTSTFEPAAKSKWTHVEPAVTRLADGRVLLSGATRGKRGQAAEVFAPTNGLWKAVKGSPPLRGHTATASADGRVFLIGGGSAKVANGQVFVLDPAKGKAKLVTELRQARREHSASLLPDGRVLVLGGIADGIEVDVVEVIDVAAGVSAVLDVAFLPTKGHTATALPDGRILVVGGDFAGLAFDDVSVFDPVLDTLLPLDSGGPAPAPAPALDFSTSAEVLDVLGAPDAFTVYYFDEVARDGSVVPATMQEWVYYDHGVAYAIDDDTITAQQPVALESDFGVEPTPYEPGQFSAYMSLTEVLATAGIEDYIVGPVDAAVEDGELFIADRLVWGIKDGEVRFVEALALGAAAPGAEDS